MRVRTFERRHTSMCIRALAVSHFPVICYCPLVYVEYDEPELPNPEPPHYVVTCLECGTVADDVMTLEFAQSLVKVHALARDHAAVIRGV